MPLNMEDDQDFEFQLQQEALEEAARQKEKETQNDATPGTSNSDNPYIYRDPNDGTELEWDPIRKAWFPRINDDFIAQYQASYGNFEETTTENESAQPTSEKSDDLSNLPEKAESHAVTDKIENANESQSGQQASNAQGGPASRKRAQPEKEPEWFEVDDDHNTNVYVSNLPMDITEEEVVELMKKCGLIMKDER